MELPYQQLGHSDLIRLLKDRDQEICELQRKLALLNTNSTLPSVAVNTDSNMPSNKIIDSSVKQLLKKLFK